MKKYNSNGFTLIEVLIALVLLSFITIMVISNTNENFEIKDRVVSEDKDRLKIFTALSMMENDISQIFSPLYFSQKFDMNSLSITITDRSDPLYQVKESLQRTINERYRNNALFYIPSEKGIPVPRFKQPDKFTFEFFTNSNRRVIENSKVSNFSWVVYTLEDPSAKDREFYAEQTGKDPDKIGSQIVRYQVTNDPFSNEDIDFSKHRPQVIMEKVDEMIFSFWNAKKEKFTPLSELDDGQGWLEAIKVSIKYKNLNDQDEKIEKIFRTLWPLYNPIDSGQNQNNQTQTQSANDF